MDRSYFIRGRARSVGRGGGEGDVVEIIDVVDVDIVLSDDGDGDGDDYGDDHEIGEGRIPSASARRRPPPPDEHDLLLAQLLQEEEGAWQAAPQPPPPSSSTGAAAASYSSSSASEDELMPSRVRRNRRSAAGTGTAGDGRYSGRSTSHRPWRVDVETSPGFRQKKKNAVASAAPTTKKKKKKPLSSMISPAKQQQQQAQLLVIDEELLTDEGEAVSCSSSRSGKGVDGNRSGTGNNNNNNNNSNNDDSNRSSRSIAVSVGAIEEEEEEKEGDRGYGDDDAVGDKPACSIADSNGDSSASSSRCSPQSFEPQGKVAELEDHEEGHTVTPTENVRSPAPPEPQQPARAEQVGEEEQVNVENEDDSEQNATQTEAVCSPSSPPPPPQLQQQQHASTEEVASEEEDDNSDGEAQGTLEPPDQVAEYDGDHGRSEMQACADEVQSAKLPKEVTDGEEDRDTADKPERIEEAQSPVQPNEDEESGARESLDEQDRFDEPATPICKEAQAKPVEEARARIKADLAERLESVYTGDHYTIETVGIDSPTKKGRQQTESSLKQMQAMTSLLDELSFAVMLHGDADVATAGGPDAPEETAGHTLSGCCEDVDEANPSSAIGSSSPAELLDCFDDKGEEKKTAEIRGEVSASVAAFEASLAMRNAAIVGDDQEGEEEEDDDDDNDSAWEEYTVAAEDSASVFQQQQSMRQQLLVQNSNTSNTNIRAIEDDEWTEYTVEESVRMPQGNQAGSTTEIPQQQKGDGGDDDDEWDEYTVEENSYAMYPPGPLTDRLRESALAGGHANGPRPGDDDDEWDEYTVEENSYAAYPPGPLTDRLRESVLAGTDANGPRLAQHRQASAPMLDDDELTEYSEYTIDDSSAALYPRGPLTDRLLEAALAAPSSKPEKHETANTTATSLKADARSRPGIAPQDDDEWTEYTVEESVRGRPPTGPLTSRMAADTGARTGTASTTSHTSGTDDFVECDAERAREKTEGRTVEVSNLNNNRGCTGGVEIVTHNDGEDQDDDVFQDASTWFEEITVAESGMFAGPPKTLNIEMRPDLHTQNTNGASFEDDDDNESTFPAATATNPPESESTALQLSTRVAELLRSDVWSRNSSVVQAALEDLRKEAEQGREYRKAIVQFGGILAIIRAMETNLVYDNIQFAACEALETMAIDEGSQRAIGDAGGIGAIIGAMNGHPNTPEVQEVACAALSRLTSHGSLNKMQVDSGAVEALVSTMEIYVDRPKIQEHGFRALSALCIDNEKRLRELSETGGLEVMTMALQVKWLDHASKHEAISTLSVLLRCLAEMDQK